VRVRIRPISVVFLFAESTTTEQGSLLLALPISVSSPLLSFARVSGVNTILYPSSPRCGPSLTASPKIDCKNVDAAKAKRVPDRDPNRLGI
jgi:hypothetical protein